MGRRFFEDLVVGESAVSGTLLVDKAEMLCFAREFDPQYFHADEEAAKTSRFGEVISSGQYTMVLWRKLDHQIAKDIAWICGVGWEQVRWPVPVRAGDTLHAKARCLDKRDSRSDASRGVVRMEYQLPNQNDQVVFQCHSTNLIEKRC